MWLEMQVEIDILDFVVLGRFWLLFWEKGFLEVIMYVIFDLKYCLLGFWQDWILGGGVKGGGFVVGGVVGGGVVGGGVLEEELQEGGLWVEELWEEELWEEGL